MQDVFAILALVFIVNITGCASLPQTLSSSTFPEKGKVIYVSEKGSFGDGACSAVSSIAADCYRSRRTYADATKIYPSKEARRAAEAANEAAVLKEIADAGAIAKVEEVALQAGTTSTGGSAAGTVATVAGFAAGLVVPAAGQGILIGAKNIHDSDGTPSGGYLTMRYKVTFKDGSKKEVKCADDEDQAYNSVCREKIVVILSSK